jgi:hypothetical protein
MGGGLDELQVELTTENAARAGERGDRHESVSVLKQSLSWLRRVRML